ncbi:hypothetical protein D3C79_1055270 [compost metagenome]
MQATQRRLYRHPLYHRSTQAERPVLHQHRLRRDGLVRAGKLNVVAERLAELFTAVKRQHVHAAAQPANF